MWFALRENTTGGRCCTPPPFYPLVSSHCCTHRKTCTIETANRQPATCPKVSHSVPWRSYSRNAPRAARKRVGRPFNTSVQSAIRNRQSEIRNRECVPFCPVELSLP